MFGCTTATGRSSAPGPPPAAKRAPSASSVAGTSRPRSAGAQARSAKPRATPTFASTSRYETPQAPIQAESGSAPGRSVQA
jgi:hypothetical protein